MNDDELIELIENKKIDNSATTNTVLILTTIKETIVSSLDAMRKEIELKRIAALSLR